MGIEQIALLLSIVSVTASAVLSFFVYKMLTHYQRLTKGVRIPNLKRVMEKQLQVADDHASQIQRLFEKCEDIDTQILTHIQKVGLHRFNPFEETGGDQSFILALLDKNDDGVVISSLHSRAGTRMYAKPIEGGIGKEHELSKEETMVVEQTRKKVAKLERKKKV